MACGLPCGPKMHAAFHAGGKCMQPSVRADNARGAEWCLLNPTGRPYEAFVAAEVAVFFSLLSRFVPLSVFLLLSPLLLLLSLLMWL